MHSDTPPPTGLARRIITFPLTRLGLALVFVLGAAIAASMAVQGLAAGLSLDRSGPAFAILGVCVTIPIVHLAYVLYVRLIERRPVTELAPGRAVVELLAGFALGAGLFATVIGAIWALGHYDVTGRNPLSVVVPVLALSMITGYVEEVIARGIIFRIVEEGLGTWIALVFSAALFGLLHMGNPDATMLSTVSIAATAGILLAAVYILTRRLWLAIGVHFAWNFVQGGIFGVAVSGHETEGLLVGELSGPVVISGGAFGAEASIFAILFGFPLGVFVVFLALRRGKFVRPAWRRSRASAA